MEVNVRYVRPKETARCKNPKGWLVKNVSLPEAISVLTGMRSGTVIYIINFSILPTIDMPMPYVARATTSNFLSSSRDQSRGI